MVPWNQKYTFLPSQSPESRDRNNIEREVFFKDPSLCIISSIRKYVWPYQKSIAATFSETIVPLSKVQHLDGPLTHSDQLESFQNFSQTMNFEY